MRILSRGIATTTRFDNALFERPIVITSAAYRFMVLEQLAEIGLEDKLKLSEHCWVGRKSN